MYRHHPYAAASSIRSINVASSAPAFELLTRFRYWPTLKVIIRRGLQMPVCCQRSLSKN